MFPKIKKRISSFLIGEEGKISKQALLSIGTFLGTGVLAAVLSAKDASAAAHTNDLSVAYSGGAATGTHGHHSSAACTSPCGGACACGPPGACAACGAGACAACACY